MTVKELIDWLKEFPEDLPVASRDGRKNREIHNALEVKTLSLVREKEVSEQTEFVILV